MKPNYSVLFHHIIPWALYELVEIIHAENRNRTGTHGSNPVNN